MSQLRSLDSGRYLLVEELGEGGMATVYRAWDQRLQVWRAIKVLQPQYSRKKKLMSRFEAEAQTMARLEHPGMVRVYDVALEGELPFIVMELVEGGSLVDWTERHGAMPPRMAVRAMIEVCDAIATAHAQGVIHRDIKPHNVLITTAGQCRVTDFGIARVQSADEGLTKTGAVMGTWGYMAPEQRVDAKNVDERADVYALGATLFSLLANRMPMDLFAADRDPSMMAGVEPLLAPLILRCAAYHREERYPSANDFASALRNIFPSLPEDPASTPPLARAAGPMRPPPDPKDYLPAPAPTPGIPATVGGGRNPTLLPGADDEPSGATTTAPAATMGQSAVSDPAFGVHPVERFAGTKGTSRPDSLPGTSPTLPGGGNYTRPDDGDVVAPPPGGGLTKYVLAFGAVAVLLAGLAVALWPSPPVERITIPVDVAADAGTGAGSGSDLAAGAGSGSGSEALFVPPPPAEDPQASSSTSRSGTEPRKPAPAPRTTETSPGPSTPEPPPPPTPPPSRSQCVSVDRTPTPADVRPGGKAVFRFKLCDKDGRKVILYFRASGAANWSSRVLQDALGAYTTTVPIDDKYAAGLDWYVTAGDVGNGSKSSPHHVDAGG